MTQPMPISGWTGDGTGQHPWNCWLRLADGVSGFAGLWRPDWTSGMGRGASGAASPSQGVEPNLCLADLSGHGCRGASGRICLCLARGLGSAASLVLRGALCCQLSIEPVWRNGGRTATWRAPYSDMRGVNGGARPILTSSSVSQSGHYRSGCFAVFYDAKRRFCDVCGSIQPIGARAGAVGPRPIAASRREASRAQGMEGSIECRLQ